MSAVSPGNFLCGCDPATKVASYRKRRHDAAGREVCPEHGEILYGSLSPIRDGNGVSFKNLHAKEEVKKIDFSMKDTRDLRTTEQMAQARALEKAQAGNGHASNL